MMILRENVYYLEPETDVDLSLSKETYFQNSNSNRQYLICKLFMSEYDAKRVIDMNFNTVKGNVSGNEKVGKTLKPLTDAQLNCLRLMYFKALKKCYTERCIQFPEEYLAKMKQWELLSDSSIPSKYNNLKALKDVYYFYGFEFSGESGIDVEKVLVSDDGEVEVVTYRDSGDKLSEVILELKNLKLQNDAIRRENELMRYENQQIKEMLIAFVSNSMPKELNLLLDIYYSQGVGTKELLRKNIAVKDIRTVVNTTSMELLQLALVPLERRLE